MTGWPGAKSMVRQSATNRAHGAAIVFAEIGDRLVVGRPALERRPRRGASTADRRSFLTTFEEGIGKHHLVHRGWEGKSEARHLKRSDRDSPVAYAKNRQLPQVLIEVGVSEERMSLFFRA